MAELINAYLNGPRTLSNDRLSYLIVSRPPVDSATHTPPLTPDLSELPPTADSQYEILFLTTHFVGDGVGLHQLANDFFVMLGSIKDQDELDNQLGAEFRARCGQNSTGVRFP